MKHLLTFLIMLVVFTTGFAQNSDYADRMEHIFGNINKSKVTTGFLKEFGIRFPMNSQTNRNFGPSME